MNKKQLIFGVGIIIGLIAMYCGYHYFQTQKTLDQGNVVIQASCSSSSTNNNGCTCSENADCTSGSCYSGLCVHCKGPFGQCASNGNCCESDCVNGTCFPIIGAAGAAWYVGSGNLSATLAKYDIGLGERSSEWYNTIDDIQEYIKGLGKTATSTEEIEEDAQLAEEGTEVAEA